MSEALTDRELATLEQRARAGYVVLLPDDAQRVVAEVRRLRQQVADLAERVAAQSELLTRRANRPEPTAGNLPQ